MKKRIFSILLCIAVCMAMMPLGVYGVNYTITVGGVSKQITAEGEYEITDGVTNGKVTYKDDGNMRTLTLKDAVINGPISFDTGKYTIIVEGTNTINAGGSIGISSSGSSMTIEGGGKLTVTGSIGIKYTGDLNFNNVEVEATRTTYQGIYCESGNIKIENSKITAPGNDSYNGIEVDANKSIIAKDAVNGSGNSVSAKEDGSIGWAFKGTIDNKFDKYNVWVAGVRVTERNKDNITGTGITLGEGGKISYTASSGTLTLNNVTIDGAYDKPAGCDSGGAITSRRDINIELIGTNTVTNSKLDGIYAAAAINITGDGSINVAGAKNGIYAKYGVDINSAVTAAGEKYGVYSESSSIGIYSTVTAKGSLAAISAASGIGYITKEIELVNGTLTDKNSMLKVKDPNANNGYATISAINYTLYYNATDGKMYKSYDSTSFKDEFTKDKSTKWSSSKSEGSNKYDVLTLNNFKFDTAADSGLKVIGMGVDETFTIKGTGENYISAYGTGEGYGIYTDGSLNFAGGRMYINVEKNDAASKAVYAVGDINLTDCELYDGAREKPKGIFADGKFVIENSFVQTNCIEAAGTIKVLEYMYQERLKVTGGSTEAGVTKVEVSQTGSYLWIDGRLRVEFDGNGGKWSDGNGNKIVPVSTDENRCVIFPKEDPVKEGYNFTGWFNSKGNKLPNDIRYDISGAEELSPYDYSETKWQGKTGVAYAHWEKASSGGGAVIPPAADEEIKTTTDSTTSETTTSTTVKDTKTETVKNEQGEDISKVTASVSEKKADALVDAAVSNKSDTVEITVKSNDGNKAEQTEVEIPKKALESIAKDTEADLVIKTDNGQVVLDNKTLETIAAEAECDTVKITVNENTQLKEEQKSVLDIIGDRGHIFDIAAVIGGKRIHDFRGGKAHIKLPVPEKLKGKDVVIIYIDNKGICEILNYTMETVGAEKYIKFTTSHFSNYAIVEKADAEKIIEKQNLDKVNSLIKEAKLKATTSKTAKKSIKVKIGEAKNSNSLIKEAKAMGYTVKYKFYRSTKKSSKYTALKTKDTDTYINTKGKEGTKYYYKAKVLVYDGDTLVTQTTLKQCKYGVRIWSK